MYEKSYQEVENLVTSSNTKMKGVAYANVTNHNIPALEQYNRIFDVSDYVIPSQVSTYLLCNVVIQNLKTILLLFTIAQCRKTIFNVFLLYDKVLTVQESNAFFIMTNFVVTPNQTRGICDEVCVFPDLSQCLYFKNNVARGKGLIFQVHYGQWSVFTYTGCGL